MSRGDPVGRPSPPSAAAPDCLGRLREALDRAGYQEAGVLGLLGVATLPSFRRRRQALAGYVHRTRGGGALETLVRLFLLREPASLQALQRAVPARPQDWRAAGLIAADPAGLVATVELTPYEGLVVAADWPGLAPRDPFEVMDVGASSRALAEMTVRRPAGQALDLGTGSGVLALLAARHSRRVVATDKNPRALAFARWNAAFNAVANISFREGELFAPVAGETFDLVVCNPPFVIAPGVEYLHTHSGLPADSLLRQIVRTAPAHLAEGGLCQLVGNWAQVHGEDWSERLAAWVAGTGCDAWVLYSHSEDVAAYARGRIVETAADAAEASEKLEAWMASYRRQRIEAVAFGVITMRRRRGAAHAFVCERLADVVAAGAEPAGPEVLRRFLENATAEPPPGPRS